METTMKEFVEYLIKTITRHPEAVSIEEKQLDKTYILLEVTVHPDDMGLVIGHRGRTIQSVRELAKAKAIQEKIKVDVELVEPDREARRAERMAQKSAEEVNIEAPAGVAVENETPEAPETDDLGAEVDRMVAELEETLAEDTPEEE